uniref:SBP-type domain-containing protein n=1 Tax=Tetraselmis sp. GSL018 TaxID=582737 RepID=A0A061SNC3_9CHLO|mmetsp:Transcript_35163/g.83407  ORF Transcript_35163/g.83407 Transcript_35163/m.83407 type:complete len:235 (+) Transcript_35163:207-911(+)
MLPDSTREANQSDSKSDQCPDDTEQIENEKKGTGKAPELSIKCAVPGCEVLSQQGFKLRHRICTKHQNMDSVMVDGIRQRFCQQCTKLHPLQMFEGQRRGCKKRLDRHNERRRLRKKLTHALEQHSKLNPSDRVYTQKDVIDLAMRLKDEVDDGSFSTKYSGKQSSQQIMSSEAKSEEERGSGGHSISANASNMVNQRSSGAPAPSVSIGSALLRHDRAGDTWDGSLIFPGSKR